MADPSDYVIKKDENNGYGQSCDNSCQTIKLSHHVSTVQEADRLNKNRKHVSSAYGLFTGLIMGGCGVPYYIAAPTGFAMRTIAIENGSHIESGDTIIYEYTVCCGGNDLGTSNIDTKISIKRK